MMRPDDGTKEELQAWNNRYVQEVLARMDRKTKKRAEPAAETPLSGDSSPGDNLAENEAATASATGAAVERPTPPPEPAPPPAPVLQAAPPPTPDPVPPQPAEPVTPEEPVRLPYRFNIMKPADVPAEVWEQARARARAAKGMR